MTDPKSTEKKNGPFTIVLMIVVGLFTTAVFLGFFILWAREGWTAAADQNPAGAAMFYLLLGLLYLMAIPVLWDKGQRSFAKLLAAIAAFAAITFVFGLFPSCSDSSNFTNELPYRK